MGYGGVLIIPPVQLPDRRVTETVTLFCGPERRFQKEMQSVTNCKIDINAK